MYIEILVASVALLGLTIGARAGSRSGRLERRLARVEAKLNRVAEHCGVRFDEHSINREEVRRLAAVGRKIEAIRVYREHHPDVGLREAREHVDQIV